MLRHVDRLLKLLRIAGTLWEEETSSPRRFRHVSLWRHGLVSDRHELYGLRENDPSRYVSDIARILQGRRINPPSLVPVLANKFVFHKVLRPQFEAHLPALLGVVVRGRIHWEPEVAQPPAQKTLRNFLEGPVAIVAKPVGGGGGKGLHVLRRTPAGLLHNGRPATVERVAALLGELDGYLLEEHLEQDAYAAAIFPASTNTLRICVMRDPACYQAFIPVAVHRFGNLQSVPTDNFSRGGFSCDIDLDTGVLGPAAGLDDEGRLVWHDFHPVTAAPIKGVSLPHWKWTKKLMVEVSDALPYLSYVGWDVVLTADGPMLIEGNHYMAPRVLQVHRPLLADRRVAAFYEHFDRRR